MILSLSGSIGSGKDTVASYLVANHGFKHESWADSLKGAISIIFGWDRELLEGKTEESRIWREKIDPWWSTKLGMPHLSPRWVLQHWGTNIGRGFHENLWTSSLEKHLMSAQKTVISDTRFLNEVASIKSLGGKTILIQRGPVPDWHEIARKANTGDTEAAKTLEALGIHPSEYSFVGIKFDHVIENNGTLEDLYKQIQKIVGKKRSRKQSKSKIKRIKL